MIKGKNISDKFPRNGVWQQSEIWRGTAVLGCINYKKVMNWREEKSVHMQGSVNALGIVPSSVLNYKYGSVCMRTRLFLLAYVCANAGSIYLQHAPLNIHKVEGNEAALSSIRAAHIYQASQVVR